MPTELRAPLPGRLRTPHWVAIDAAAVGAFVAAGLAEGWPALNDRAPAWLAMSAGLGALLPLVVRRIWPLPACAAVLVCSTASVLISGASYPSFELALAIYPVAARLPARRALAALAVALAAICLGVILAPAAEGTGSVLGLLMTSVVLVAAAWAIGFVVREHRSYSARLQELAAEQAVGQERLRIARELHDVVAHGMSVIAVQASVANYVVDEQPEEARRALGSIEEASRNGLQELRYMLGVLRADDGYHVDGVSAPGMAGLDALVCRFREAGLQVRMDVAGAARPLPPAVDLSLYRIIQEALTNVVKHAGRAAAEVMIDFRPDGVAVRVTDDGRGAHRALSAAHGGHGIGGMRERVAVFGGEFTAEPLAPPATGFRVSALFPLTEAPA